MHELVQQLDLLDAEDDDYIFYDYLSLPQVPRTPPEDQQFQEALLGMQDIYSFGCFEVIVLPRIHLPCDTRTEYFARGWCFFELAVSVAFNNVCNDKPYIANKDVQELVASVRRSQAHT